jgi:hypothetical protein
VGCSCALRWTWASCASHASSSYLKAVNTCPKLEDHFPCKVRTCCMHACHLSLQLALGRTSAHTKHTPNHTHTADCICLVAACTVFLPECATLQVCEANYGYDQPAYLSAAADPNFGARACSRVCDRVRACLPSRSGAQSVSERMGVDVLKFHPIFRCMLCARWVRVELGKGGGGGAVCAEKMSASVHVCAFLCARALCNRCMPGQLERILLFLLRYSIDSIHGLRYWTKQMQAESKLVKLGESERVGT